ncbi:hypothetical protein [Algoriphagus resistens]|uniref:hypothetical protein n=1 Tax=Algoriphagus resistens TaxID=1750590 RepID=UPI000716816D|nr:hypothetical protein [Algoriphagus resistens]
MIEAITSKWYDLEILRSLAREYYFQACHNTCKFSRGRAGWDLHKTNMTKRKFQRQFVELCDMAMSDKELYQLLKSENLQILIK